MGPIVAPMNDCLYIGIKHSVLCLAKRNGKEIWRTKLKGCTLVNVVVDGDFVYAYTRGHLYALDANTGPVFMDTESYEQFGLDREILGDAMHYVRENDEVEVTFHEGRAIGIRLPAKVDLVITETDPAVKGDTVNSVMKEATVETGFVLKVPSHIRLGDKIRISTVTGEFQERVND